MTAGQPIFGWAFCFKFFQNPRLRDLELHVGGRRVPTTL